MTIKEANNFYKNDKKKYDLRHNTKFVEQYNKLIKDGYISYLSIHDLQEIINKLVIWYEIKEPDREYDKERGVIYADYFDLKSLSDEMNLKQFEFRLSNNEKCLLSGVYRTGCGGAYYNKELNKYVPKLYITFKRIESEEDEFSYYRNEYGIHFDGITGKITNFFRMPSELNLEDDMTIERLLVVLGKIDKFDLTKIKKCIKLHETDLKLRNLILQYTALALMYSGNTIPEYGYKRAKKFIEEFNTYYNLNLNTKEIDNLINQDYSLNENEKYCRLEGYELNKLVREQKRMIKSMKR